MSKYKRRSILKKRMERQTKTTLHIYNIHLFQKANYKIIKIHHYHFRREFLTVHTSKLKIQRKCLYCENKR